MHGAASHCGAAEPRRRRARTPGDGGFGWGAGGGGGSCELNPSPQPVLVCCSDPLFLLFLRAPQDPKVPPGRLARKAREELVVNLVPLALWAPLEKGCVQSAAPHLKTKKPYNQP